LQEKSRNARNDKKKEPSDLIWRRWEAQEGSGNAKKRGL